MIRTAPRTALRSTGPLSALLSALLLAACAHGAPSPKTFHYRSAAHPLPVGERWSPTLDGDAVSGFADAVMFHLDQTGVLQVSTQSSSPKVAVLIYTAGKTPLVHNRGAGAIETPPIRGDVFVVVRALRGAGVVSVQLDSFVAPSAPGVQPAPPTSDVIDPASIDLGTAPGNDLPLDDLLSNDPDELTPPAPRNVVVPAAPPAAPDAK